MRQTIAAIIQARTGSTRLPAKVVKRLKGKTVLRHVIERVKQSTLVDELIVATTTSANDDIIEQEALNSKVKVFRGSEKDVLGRYYHAAKQNRVDIIVRITSDCPLIDPRVIDDTINLFLRGNCHIATNAGAERTFPRGLDAEVFSFDMLEDAFLNGQKTYQREHVTPYIYETADRIFYLKNATDHSKFRWTLDTEEDFELISQIYDRLYHGKHDFFLTEVLELFAKEPCLFHINQHVQQKSIK